MIFLIVIIVGSIAGTIALLKLTGMCKYLRLPDFQEPTWQKIQWISLILFMVATLVFVVLITHFEISTAQHVWCHVINTLNHPPAPKGNPLTNPARAYDQELAREFLQLKGQLGC